MLSVQRLHKWIRLGWVRPERREGAAYFHEVDVARVRLLSELEHDLEFDEDTVPLVLSLLDQIHGLRNELRSLARPSTNNRLTFANVSAPRMPASPIAEGAP